MQPSPSSHLTLRPPWLYVVRALWILIAAACFSLFVVGNLNVVRSPLPSCTSPETTCSPTAISREDVQIAQQMGFPIPFYSFTLIFSILARLSMAAVGLVIFWRKSDDWLAMMMSGGVLTVLIEGGFGELGEYGILLALLYGIGTALFLPLPFIFPNGRWEPNWIRWVVVPLTIAGAFSFTLSYFDPRWFELGNIFTMVWTFLAVYAMVFRYTRMSNAAERQQTKWVLLGLTSALMTGIYFTLMTTFLPVTEPSEARIIGLAINGVFYLGGYGFFSFSVFVAILRYRLWDIGIVIRRTLQYTLLTGILALVYFSGIAVIQGFFTAITGQQSPVATVLSTLAIAALFNPLRLKIHEFIDRRFYRSKYDAEKALLEFALSARSETDLQMLANDLTTLVKDTLNPERVNLWLKEKSS